MTGGLIGLVGLSAAVAAGVTAVLVLALRLTGRRTGAAALALCCLLVFFLGLTQFPLPDPATMVCPVPWTEPRLEPFRFVRRLIGILSRPDRIGPGLLALGVAAALMNLILLAAIGAALAGVVRWRVGVAALAGLGLSLAVELTQLTAFWGLYPCPWRQFDLDDLVLNTAGVTLGYGLAAWIRRRRAV